MGKVRSEMGVDCIYCSTCLGLELVTWIMGQINSPVLNPSGFGVDM